MTRKEAIEKALSEFEPYLKQERISDAQAARLGRALFANLKQVKKYY